MENLPENQNNTSTQEFSTVFSDPTEHKKVAKSKGSNRLKIALSLVLAVAILLGGTIAVIKLIPERETGQGVTNNDIVVLDYEIDQIKDVVVENQNGKFNFYSEKVESDETGTTVTNINWYINGYDKELTSSSSIYNVVESVIDIKAIREITGKTVVECGLDTPLVKAEITTLKDERETVLIGAKSPDNVGVYVKLANNEKIYLVGEALDSTLSFTDLDLASTQAQGPVMLDKKYADYCNELAVIKSDYVTVEGVNFPKKMVFAPTEEQEIALFTPYEAIEPMKRSAQNVETLFKVFSGGFNVSGAYSYDVKSETLNKLGLQKPDFVLSAVFGDYTYSYKFKQQQDGNYAVVGNDSKNVKMVTISDCNFLSYSTNDLYNPILFLASIDDVSNLTFETESEKYSFDITVNLNGDDTNKYKVSMGDKTFNSSYFQSFWQYLSSLQTIDFGTEKLSGNPELIMTYTYNKEGVKPTKIAFIKENAVRYQYSIDGVPMGKIGSSDYTKILKNLKRLLEGKQIVVN
ncbi:MAG: DUF4340 domain-containing protein [Clostridia bacterium]|nr:DUF4340 domain-containing protein [Clostridia bacterium]